MALLEIDPRSAHVGNLSLSHAKISCKENDKALPGLLGVAGLQELLEFLIVKGVIPRSHEGGYATSCISVVAWCYIVIVSPYKLEMELMKKRNISYTSVAEISVGLVCEGLYAYAPFCIVNLVLVFRCWLTDG
jgi:hypothetical protein